MRILTLVVAALLSASASATELRFTLLHLPLFFNGDDREIAIEDIAVPFISAAARPEAIISAINSPYLPHHDKSWRKPIDCNMVTAYGISFDMEQESEPSRRTFIINTSAAKVPANFPFSIQDVVDHIKICAERNFPSSKDTEVVFRVVTTVAKRSGEQGGARQPATAPESVSEGKEEPKPESEGCPP